MDHLGCSSGVRHLEPILVRSTVSTRSDAQSKPETAHGFELLEPRGETWWNCANYIMVSKWFQTSSFFNWSLQLEYATRKPTGVYWSNWIQIWRLNIQRVASSLEPNGPKLRYVDLTEASNACAVPIPWPRKEHKTSVEPRRSCKFEQFLRKLGGTWWNRWREWVKMVNDSELVAEKRCIKLQDPEGINPTRASICGSFCRKVGRFGNFAEFHAMICFIMARFWNFDTVCHQNHWPELQYKLQ